MLNTIISYSFYILFFLTPFIWIPLTNEYFEFNKMMFVYLMTVIIVGSWTWKSINQGRFIFNKTPLDLPIALFLTSQVLSTIFSIDLYTSIFGYYSRENGGLLSIISYVLLYYALVSNLNKNQVIKLLKIGFLAGVIVALWAIPESSKTYSKSLSCGILYTQKYLSAGESLYDIVTALFQDPNQIINAECWVQDVKARVFATLGQPNWLAAYLGMTIFFGLPFFLSIPNKFKQIIFLISLVLSYLAFTFTYSRGGMIGLLSGLTVFTTGVLLLKNKRHIFLTLLLIGTFIVTNLNYGSAFTRFELGQLLPKPQQTQSTPQTETIQPQPEAPKVTQLENGGTESGQIRLIVWKGAWEIFKHYPLFGSGVETFAYSYEMYRIPQHNVTSEWDFTYNKAHNEYINYLATTGILGFLSYLYLIGKFLIWSIKRIVILNAVKNLKTNIEIAASPSSIAQDPRNDRLLVIAIFAAYISYLIQNIFGFSVVMIALFFYLIPGISFIITEQVKERFFLINTQFINIFKLIAVVIFCVLLVNLFQIWYADFLFTKGETEGTRGNGDKAHDYMLDATELNKWEPYYGAKLGYTAATIALFYSDVDATVSAKFKKAADEHIQNALEISPSNLSLYHLALSAYFQLAAIDGKYTRKTLEIVDKKILLAPNHPRYYYERAVILEALQEKEMAIETLKKAIALKADYKDAYFSLADLYFEQGEKEKAEEIIKKVFNFIPNDPDVLDRLDTWKSK